MLVNHDYVVVQGTPNSKDETDQPLSTCMHLLSTGRSFFYALATYVSTSLSPERPHDVIGVLLEEQCGAEVG